jgi:hypothetical protein
METVQSLKAYSAIYDTAALARIDAENGVIHGVSVITEGPALGHGAWVDVITLQQVVSCASEYAQGLRVNNDHGSDLFSAAGFLRNFRLEKRGGYNRVTADLHVLASETHRAKLLELASTIPDTFGLSVVMSGPHEKREGRTYLRCEELLSADLVPEPAANPTGLFSRPVSNKTILSKMTDEELKASISSLVADAVEGRLSTLEKTLKALTESGEKKDEELAALKAELSTVKADDKSRIELAATMAKEIVSSLRLSAGPAITPAPEKTPAPETFEDKVIAALSTGKSKGEAISLTARAHPDLHKNYLARVQLGTAKSIAA